jgi:hypothetical protein
MGGGRDFFSEEKTQMWCWIGENVKTAEIARHLGRQFGAVRYNSKNISLVLNNLFRKVTVCRDHIAKNLQKTVTRFTLDMFFNQSFT